MTLEDIKEKAGTNATAVNNNLPSGNQISNIQPSQVGSAISNVEFLDKAIRRSLPFTFLGKSIIFEKDNGNFLNENISQPEVSNNPVN